MNKNMKKMLVPKVRFPEFRDAGEWEESTLGSKGISTFVKERSPFEQLKLATYVSTENLLSDYAGVTIATRLPPNGSFTRFKKGDILISNIRPYLKKVWAATMDGASSNDVIVIRSESKVSNAFLTFLLKNDEFINYIMKSAKGVKMPRGDISLMKEYSLAVTDPKEQQKIADCLSSIDEIISAQRQKVEVLTTHKNGLMRQLFPREGETFPRLRFPEFRDAGEWEEKRLGDIGSVRMCKRIFKEETTPCGDIPFYKIGTFGGAPDAFISREIFESYKNNYPFPKKGSVLISAAGTIGRTIIYEGELAYFQDSNIVWLDNNENLIANSFLFYLYQLIIWTPSVGAIQRLYNENILVAKIKFPSISEQQKIADCLSSIDALISAHRKKLDTLKIHKKSLMQQLFPVVDKVKA